MKERQSQRYARHLLLPGFGESAQQKLLDAKVLLIGAGGLGSPCALYLAAAGIGHLTIVDDDIVELSNLQRQVLHKESSVGYPKVESAQDTLSALNSETNVTLVKERFTELNAESLVASHDIVVDGSDNFATRFLVNDACFFGQKPLVYGSIFQFEGQVTVFDPARGGPCYRCLIPEPPEEGLVPNCLEAGVIGTLPGVIGSLQAMEVIKYLTNLGKSPVGKMLHYQALETEFRSVTLAKDPCCPLCSSEPKILKLEALKEIACALESKVQTQTFDEFLRRGDEPYFLLDVREPEEFAQARVPGSQLIPLGQISEHLEQIPRQAPIYVYCHAGSRSLKAAQQLMEAGFSDVINLEGGILAYQKLQQDT